MGAESLEHSARIRLRFPGSRRQSVPTWPRRFHQPVALDVRRGVARMEKVCPGKAARLTRKSVTASFQGGTQSPP